MTGRPAARGPPLLPGDRLMPEWIHAVLAAALLAASGPPVTPPGGRSAAAPAQAPTCTAPATAPTCTAPTCTAPALEETSCESFPVPAPSAPLTAWIRRPPGYGPQARPALLIALHGTDDGASDAAAFWGALAGSRPLLVVAPQSSVRGWCDLDIPALQAMRRQLPDRLPHDEGRVFLAGFSAGGAMAMQLVYGERFPVSAAAALANYLPPTLQADDLRAGAGVPVLYAVGMRDINHELMRAGLERLRAVGAEVELYRPPIAHRLDPAVGRQAIDWFFAQADRQWRAFLAGVEREPSPARDLPRIEQVIASAAWHDPEHVDLAVRAAARLEVAGRENLAAARVMLDQGRIAEGLERLARVERDYGQARLGRQARAWRERIQADPAAQAQSALQSARQRDAEAMEMYAAAQQMVARQRLADAAEKCRQVIRIYHDTPAATRARHLLKLIEPESQP